MALTEQLFTGADGVALTTANSGYSLVSPSGGAGFTYETSVTNPVTGGSVGKITAPAGTAAEGRYTHADSTSAAQQLVFRVPPTPTASICDILQTRGTRQNAGLRIHTTGSLRVLAMGSEVSGAAWAGWAELVGRDVVVDLLTIEGDTATSGRIAARVRALDDLGAVLWSYDSGTTRDAGVVGTDVINRQSAWKLTAAAAFASDWLVFAHRAQEGVTAFLGDPPVFVADPVPVAHESDPRAVDLRGSTVAAGQTLTYTLAHVSGPNRLADVVEPLDGLFLIPRDTTTSAYRATITASPSGGSRPYDITVTPAGGGVDGIVEQVRIAGAWAD